MAAEAIQEADAVQEFVDQLPANRLSDLSRAIRMRELTLTADEILTLPEEEQDRIVRLQAEDASKDYDPTEWEDWQRGDFHD